MGGGKGIDGRMPPRTEIMVAGLTLERVPELHARNSDDIRSREIVLPTRRIRYGNVRLWDTSGGINHAYATLANLYSARGWLSVPKYHAM